MHRSWRPLLLALALATVNGTGAAAQFTSLPVHVSPNISPRLTTVMVAGEIGVTQHNLGAHRPIAARVVLNRGRLSLTAGAGVLYDPDLDDEFTLGAGVGVDLYAASPSKPTVTIFGAAGHTRVGVGPDGALDRWDFPVGVGFAWYLPALDLNAEPWIAPRAHVRLRESLGDLDAGSDADFGVGASGGLNLTHAIGPGLNLAVDALWIGDPLQGDARIEFVFSAGVHVKLALP